jgi:hypothetical protein
LVRYIIKKFIDGEDDPITPLADFGTDCSDDFCVIGRTSDRSRTWQRNLARDVHTPC